MNFVTLYDFIKSRMRMSHIDDEFTFGLAELLAMYAGGHSPAGSKGSASA